MIRVEYEPLEKIIKANRNPKGHDIGGVSGSIKRFGYVDPVIVNEKTGKLVAGHGRLETLLKLKAMGEEAPERILVKGDQWLIPVIRGIEFENEREAEAYLLASNRLVEIGGWEDEPVLAQMLSELGDLTGTGFNEDDLDLMLERLKSPNIEREEEAETDAEEAIGKWQVKEGQIYSVKDHLVICGDSEDSGIFEWIRGNAKIAGVITSPPYAMQRKEKYGGVLEKDYIDWFDKIQKNLAFILDQDGSFFLNIKAHSDLGERSLYVLELVINLRLKGWYFIDEYCWLRNPPPGSWNNRFKNGFEPIYHLAKTTDIKFRPNNVKDKTKIGESYASSNINNQDYFNTAHEGFRWDGSLPSNVLDYRKNAPGTGHSAAFPTEVPEFFIKAFSDKGDTWLDPFVGSGTTILAADINNRRAIGIEKDPNMMAICLERLANILKQTPERSGDI